jgi:hypothetical protein
MTDLPDKETLREQAFEKVCDVFDRDIKIVSVLAGEYLIDNPARTAQEAVDAVLALVYPENKEERDNG